MFYLFLGIVIGVWLDQSFTFPPIQDYLNAVGDQYKKHTEHQE